MQMTVMPVPISSHIRNKGGSSRTWLDKHWSKERLWATQVSVIKSKQFKYQNYKVVIYSIL